MLPQLRAWTGLQSASPLEIAKYLAGNVGGKASAIIVAVMGTVYLVAPMLPSGLSAFCGRLQWTCVSYLLAIFFFRQARNSKLLTTTLAALTIADPRQTSSPDPAVQREIVKQELMASGVMPRP